MKEGFIKYIVVAMSAALLGLMGLQFYWIQNALKVTERQFDQQVYDAIKKVSETLEQVEGYKLVQEVIRDKGKISFMSKVPVDSLGLLRVQSMLAKVDSTSKTDQTIETAAMSAEVTGKWILNADNDMIQLMDTSGNAFKNAISINNSNYALKDRLPLMQIDSVLKSAFKNTGINTEFEFMVESKETYETLFQSSEPAVGFPMEDAFVTSLFPSNSLGYEKAELMVSFPRKQLYLLTSTALVIVLSLLFIVIILGAFIYVTKGFVRQKKLSQIKNDFINNMTHEFKTPIATISLAADSINNPLVLEDKEQLRSYSRIIREESQRMNDHVETVLQTSLLENKQLKLNLKALDLNEIIERSIATIELSLKPVNGELKTKLSSTPLNVKADDTHLTNVILNLIDNAIKYSEEVPAIDITSSKEGKNVILKIKDRGIGIAQESLEKLFEKFYRVPTGDLHSVKGFGLGLAYVKSVVELHGGKVLVESELGKGTIFSVILPIDNG